MRGWLVNTFSIVAFDSDTGEFGSASASRSLGVGVVNTQHYANLCLGETALGKINASTHPQEALESALASAPKAQARVAHRDRYP